VNVDTDLFEAVAAEADQQRQDVARVVAVLDSLAEALHIFGEHSAGQLRDDLDAVAIKSGRAPARRQGGRHAAPRDRFRLLQGGQA
jgi:hypothetical protein